jgi:phage-related protein
MTVYTEAPTIDVATIFGDAAANSSQQTNKLMLAAADSCGLLGAAQGFVNESAAQSTQAADAAINKTLESAGNLAKKMQDAASSKLVGTFNSANAYIQSLFDSATPSLGGGFESLALDQFLASISSAISSIQGAFSAAITAISTAASNAAAFAEDFIGDIVNAANQLRILACPGATQALTAVGPGVSTSFDALAGPLNEGKTSNEILKENNSAPIKAKADAAAADAASVNAQADSALTVLNGVDGQADQILGLIP